MHVYQSQFFSGHSQNSQRSARKIVPELLKAFPAKTVLDVGCGDGTWLAEFANAGVVELVGVDGPYLPDSLLKIPPASFIRRDLSQPLDLGRKFDLVTSLEVAEHLPAESAETFVRSLARHSDLIVFSAAVPGQYGEHHINEQWPKYWVNLFQQNGLRCFDVLREQFWTDPEISWWYRQNMLVFATKERASQIPLLASYDAARRSFPLEVAHPDFMALFRDTLSEEESGWELTKKILRLYRRRLRILLRV